MSKYTDDLEAALGLVNEYMISHRYGCPRIVFSTQHPHAFGTRDHRVEVTFLREGKWFQSKPIRIREGRDLAESRKAHLKAAVEWAEKAGLGIEEWVPSGFANSWIPKPVKDQIMADLKAWRKQQAAGEGAP